MQQKPVHTEGWRNAVEVTEDIEELSALLRELETKQSSWPVYLAMEKESRGLKTAVLAKRCGLTRQGIEKWQNKGALPDSRTTFIKLGMAFGMNLTEMNHLLQRYGKYPKLYAKNMHDALCLYVIEQYGKTTPESAKHVDYPYGHVEALDARLQEKLSAWEVEGALGQEDRTLHVQAGIASAPSDADFLEYLREHRTVFLSHSYQQLEQCIHDFIRIQQLDATDPDAVPTIHALVQSGMLAKGFEKVYSQLHTRGEVPSRLKLIAIGLSFNMTVEMIDQLLSLAGMEPLCARDRLELVLIFAVRCAHIYDPTLEYDIAHKLSQSTQDEGRRRQCAEIKELHERILRDYPPSKLEIGSVNEYVRHVLAQLRMEEEAGELLDLLSP